MAKSSCPQCGRLVDVASLTYSAALEQFVCPACHIEVGDIEVAPPPAPAEAPAPARTPATSNSQFWLIATLLAGAVCITTVAILLVSGGEGRQAGVQSDQRAWDIDNSAKIIALKSEAEGLALEGKLTEAHAKYREIEKIVGGRQVKDPSLFDMVEVARQDQDKIYKLLLSRMERDTSPATSPDPTPVPEQSRVVPLPSYAKPITAPVEAPVATGAAPADTAPVTQAAQSLPIPRGPVTDEEVGEAIQKGVDFLLSNFEGGEVRIGDNDHGIFRQGIDALCVYALASSSKAISDPRLNAKGPEMIQMLERLKGYEFDNGRAFQMPVTYGRSLRAAALATFNRPQDRGVLADDVDWLVNAHTEGAYTYDDQFAPERKRKVPQRSPATKPARGGIKPRAALGDGVILPTIDDPDAPRVILADGTFTPRPPPPPPPPPPPSITPIRSVPRPIYRNTLPQGTTPPPNKYKSDFPWDNSNSQYGLLGVWAGAEVGIEVPTDYWRSVEQHWTTCQLPSGEWCYSALEEPGRFSMTCAGIASLLVTHDYLTAPAIGGKTGNTRQAYSSALTAGLAWLEDGDNAVRVSGNPLFYVGYNLFGLERVGLASGFKQFGAYDWFVELTRTTLKVQRQDGSFGINNDLERRIIDTAYVLLFLSRGRHPIMYNKLRYDGAWANRPREVANLAGFASKELERPLNWQVVDIVREPFDWADSPILFIPGSKKIAFGAEEMSKFQTFVDNGGIIFTQAEQGAEEFNRFAADFAKQLFPAYEMKDLPVEHELYKLNYTIPLPRPRLQAVSNGVRLLMVHSPTDLTVAWQQRSTVSRKDAFQLGTNLYLYATGKEKFRNRLDTPLIPAPTTEPQTTIHMARLHYQGNWDPEPGAWPRMARMFEWETGIRLGITPVDMDELTIDKFRIAHLTGTAAFAPDDRQLGFLRQFIESGGTLLIDASGGAGAFADCESTWLPKLLGNTKLETVQPGDPLYKRTIDGTVDVPEKSLRLYALQQLGREGPRIKSAKLGKGRVIFSALDITSGLLGMNHWGIVGYLPEYSEAVVKNLVLLSSTDPAAK